MKNYTAFAILMGLGLAVVLTKIFIVVMFILAIKQKRRAFNQLWYDRFARPVKIQTDNQGVIGTIGGGALGGIAGSGIGGGTGQAIAFR